MTLWSLRGRVRELKANASKESIEGAINRAILNAVDGRRWADLLRLGNIVVPAPYTTGTISTAVGSKIITGVATAWPLVDHIDTVYDGATFETGFVEITPASMTNIEQGQYLLLDAGTATEEIVAVSSVTEATFFAQCRYAHDDATTIQASTLVGRQLRVGNAVYTVRAVRTATSLETDLPFGGVVLTDQAYRIYMAYARISPTTRKLIDAWDPVAGCPIGVNKTMDWLTRNDPQRTSSGDPQELVSLPPSQGGVMQWEIWPSNTGARLINTLYQDGWPTLVADNDISPPFLNPEIFIASAAADVLISKVIPRDGKQDPFYDPTAAAYWKGEYNRLLETGTQTDEARYLQSLRSYTDILYGGSTNWARSHAVSADWGGGWGGWGGGLGW